MVSQFSIEEDLKYIQREQDNCTPLIKVTPFLKIWSKVLPPLESREGGAHYTYVLSDDFKLKLLQTKVFLYLNKNHITYDRKIN